MDDVPCRTAESSRTESDAGVRGIYDVATDFVPMHREIMRGVSDFVGKRCTQDVYLELVQRVSIKAWEKAQGRPGCFAHGELRRWAWRNAQFRYKDLVEEHRKHALTELAVQREHEAGNFDTPLTDVALEAEDELPRAIANGLKLLDTVSRWVVIEVLLRNLSRRKAAAELGITKGKVDRKIAKALPVLASALADWDPHAPRVSSATRPTLRERGDQ